MTKPSCRAGWIGCALLVVLSGHAIAALDSSWFTVDGGGGLFSAGPGFELSGTIGQPDAGQPMIGSGFELTGGFWPGVAPPCIGDFDGNAQVDLGDLAILLANFGTTSGAGPEDGDTDGDGDVDLADLAVLLSSFGTVCS